jgi:hypothetical protein
MSVVFQPWRITALRVCTPASRRRPALLTLPASRRPVPGDAVQATRRAAASAAHSESMSFSVVR